MSSHVTINLQHTMYRKLLSSLATERGWRIVYDEEFNEADLNWIDLSASIETVSKLQHTNMLNHLPDIIILSRKAELVKAFRKVQKKSCEFNFFPQTWILPKEHRYVKEYFNNNSTDEPQFLILKPNKGQRGEGIRIASKYQEVRQCASGKDYIAQKYLSNPYLMQGRKCDLRVYVLLTSINPFVAFVHRNGLCRLCSEPYEIPSNRNLARQYIHLTNFSVNKRSENFTTTENHSGSINCKRTLKDFLDYVEQDRGKSIQVWNEIKKVLKGTLQVVKHDLQRSFNISTMRKNPQKAIGFELLGFDIMIDSSMKPWLIEVNHSPSIAMTTYIDKSVKHGLLSDTLTIVESLLHHNKTIMNSNNKNNIRSRLKSGRIKRRRYREVIEKKVAIKTNFEQLIHE